MNLSGNTIFITGGGSGIGRGLAEALQKRGNKVIISGRDRAKLDSVVQANPGMEAVALDVMDPGDIQKVASHLIRAHPELNVLINNSGIMLLDDSSKVMDEDPLTRQIETNLLGAIRMSSALVEQLKTQMTSWIVYNSSVLAFTPLAHFAAYSATKAALHSYAMSQRFMLRNTSVRVQEIAPPWVGTGLVGDAADPRAMPLDKFIAGTIEALGTDAEEVLVEEALVNRNNPGPKEHAFVNALNAQMKSAFSA
jgi:uncharacterized oxidoreductase